LSRNINRFFGDCAGDALARARIFTGPSVLIVRPVKGTAHCEGCAMRKPITGKSKKGWRCDDCKQRKNDAKNNQNVGKLSLDGYPQVSNTSHVA